MSPLQGLLNSISCQPGGLPLAIPFHAFSVKHGIFCSPYRFRALDFPDHSMLDSHSKQSNQKSRKQSTCHHRNQCRLIHVVINSLSTASSSMPNQARLSSPQTPPPERLLLKSPKPTKPISTRPWPPRARHSKANGQRSARVNADA